MGPRYLLLTYSLNLQSFMFPFTRYLQGYHVSGISHNLRWERNVNKMKTVIFSLCKIYNCYNYDYNDNCSYYWNPYYFYQNKNGGWTIHSADNSNRTGLVIRTSGEQ